jgi:predicted component of type VI protein secretion system
MVHRATPCYRRVQQLARRFLGLLHMVGQHQQMGVARAPSQDSMAAAHGAAFPGPPSCYLPASQLPLPPVQRLNLHEPLRAIAALICGGVWVRSVGVDVGVGVGGWVRG